MSGTVEAQKGETQNILIIESDKHICSSLVSTLTQQGYSVLSAHDGREGLRAFFRHHPHLIILATELPGINGWQVLQRIREVAKTPVILILEADRPGHSLRAFELDADDCLAKPLNQDEVALRVAAILRRSSPRQAGIWVYDDGILHIDVWKRVVMVNGQSLALSNHEMALLARLAQQPGLTVHYDRLFEDLPWLDRGATAISLRSLLQRLRRKLRAAAPGTDYITTRYGVGVRLNVPAPLDKGTPAPQP